MSTGGAQSRAVYEGELVDKITKPVQSIVGHLAKLHKVMDAIGKPVGQMNAAFKDLNKSVDQMSRTAGRSTNTFMQISNGLQAFQRGIFVVGQGIGSFLKQLGGGLRAIGLFATALSGTLAGALLLTTMRAAEAQDSLAAFDQVFGDQADSVGQWAKDYAEALGRSERATKEGLTRFRSFFLGIGRSEEEATEFSKALVAMAADLSAFNGSVTESEAMTRLQSALSGTAEALDIFGIALRVGSLDTFMQQMGMSGAFKDLEESEKVLVRLSAIMEGMRKSKMLGQADREVSNFRNLVNNAFAIVGDTVDELGMKIIDVLTPSFVSLGVALKTIQNVVKNIDAEKIKQMLGFVVVAGAIGAALIALGTALSIIGQLAIVATGVTTAFTALFTVISTVGTLFGPVAAAIVAIAVAVGPVIVGLGTLISYLSIRNFAFVEALNGVADTAGRVFDTITRGSNALIGAIINQDWDSAWMVVTLAGELAFRQLLEQVKVIVGEMTFAVERGISEAFNNISEQMSTGIGNVLRASLRGTAAGAIFEQFLGKGLDARNAAKSGGGMSSNMQRIIELNKALDALKATIEKGGGFDVQSLYERLRQMLGDRLGAANQGRGPEGAMLQTTSAYVAARNENFMPVTMDPNLKEAQKQTQIQGDMLGALNEIKNMPVVRFA